MLNLRRAFEAFDSVESSAALTPWFKLATPRLVLCMDGSLLGGFEYAGRDIQNCPPELHEAIASTLQQAVRSLDHRCTVWAYTDKRTRKYTNSAASKSPLGDYAYNALRDIADGSDATGYRHYLYVSMQPFQGAMGFLDEIAEKSKKGGGYLAAVMSVLKNRLSPSAQIRAIEATIESVVQDFEAKLRQFGQLLGARCAVHVMEGDRLLGALASRYNVLTPTETLKWPETHNDWFSPAFLNTYLPTEVRKRHPSRDYVMVHEGNNGRTRYSAVLTFKSLTHADSDLTELLMCMPWDISVGSRFAILEEESTRSEMRKAETHYRDNVYGVMKRTFAQISGGELTNPDMGMVALADGVADALREQGEHRLLYGYFAQTVQVLADTEDELLSAVESINASLTNASGVPLILERMGMLAAQMLMLPGTNGYVFRQYPVSTRALACMLALRTISAGQDSMPHVSSVLGEHVGALLPLPTVFPVPHLLNPFVGDLGHFAIVGAPGNGKTTLINLLLLGWSRVPRSRAFVLDIDGSSRITITALGGQYSSFELNREGQPTMRLAPAQWIKSTRHHASLAAWLRVAMTAFEGDRLTPDQVSNIEKVIGLAHTSWSNAASMGRPHAPKLSDLYELFLPIDSNLASRLRPWIQTGANSSVYSAAFDHSEDNLATSDIWGVDISAIMKDEPLSAAVLAYIFAVVDETLEKERPTLGYAAELATVFRNKTFAVEFENWLRRFRKRNCFIGFDAHAASDISGLDEAEAFAKAIKTWYLLPNPRATAGEYSMQMLDPTDAEMIRDALPKRHYLLVQEGHKRMLDLALPPHLLVLTRSDDVAKATFDKHVASGSREYLKNYADELIERDQLSQFRAKRH